MTDTELYTVLVNWIGEFQEVSGTSDPEPMAKFIAKRLKEKIETEDDPNVVTFMDGGRKVKAKVLSQDGPTVTLDDNGTTYVMLIEELLRRGLDSRILASAIDSISCPEAAGYQ